MTGAPDINKLMLEVRTRCLEVEVRSLHIQVDQTVNTLGQKLFLYDHEHKPIDGSVDLDRSLLHSQLVLARVTKMLINL